MRSLLKYYTLIICVLFVIYHKVECTSENNGTNLVTRNMNTNGEQTNMNTRNIPIEILSALGRKFFSNWLPSFTSYVQGRCFGAVRKLQMAFIPLFFKLGVIGTMLTFLTAMTAKSLLIGIMLLFFNFTGFFAKFYASKLAYHAPSPSWSTSGWTQPAVQPQIKNIHVHVHPPLSSSHHTDELDHTSSLHQPISEYESHHLRPSLYHHKLASLGSTHHHSGDFHHPFSDYSTYPSHPLLYQHKLDDINNSLLPDSSSVYHTNNYRPDIGHRYDDISHLYSGAVLTAEENAYIERILSKLS